MNFLDCSLSSDFFSLTITQSEKNSTLTMRFFNSAYYNTRDLTQTIPLLSKRLPQIFHHKCLNGKHYSFLTEAKNTEVAHLFEHILLEYLVQYQSIKSQVATYKGETAWNWQQEPQGIFHININTKPGDISIFLRALGQSLLLLQEIFQLSLPSTTSPTTSVSFKQ